MRMWMVDPKIMCRKHLLGEHVETHMFYGSVEKGKKIDGFLKNNLFEPLSLYYRHKQLEEEMIRRGYNHQSPMEDCAPCFDNLNLEQQYTIIDHNKALRDLLDRCPECRQRWSSHAM